MHNFFQNLLIIVSSIFGFGYQTAPAPAPVPAPVVIEQPAAPLAATNAIESPVALFTTSLANGITTTATSMTLVSATTKDGSVLASSTYSFVLDEGTASEEFVRADCTSTACTNMDRGISVLTGTTTVATLKKSHKRGASVKITDGPLLVNLTRIMNGIGTFPNILSYTSHPTFTSNTQVIDKKYADDLSFTGVPDMSATVKGVGEKATAAEAAAGAADGSGNTTAPLVLTAGIATSTCQSAANSVLVASSTTGKLAGPCFDQTYAYTFTGTNSFNSTTTANGTLAVGTTSPSNLAGLDVGTPAYFSKGVGIGIATSTSSANLVVAGLASTTNLVVSNNCTNCVTFTNGTATRAGNTASGSQTIAHGLGAIPKYVRIRAVKTIGTTFFTESTGVYNGVTTSDVYLQIGSAASPTFTSGVGTNMLDVIDEPQTPKKQVATISVDATNITLSWTMITTPSADTISMLWEAQK